MIVASFYTPRPDEYPNKQYDFDELLFLLDKSCRKLDFKHLVISDETRPKPLNTFLTYLPSNLMRAIIYGQMRLLFESREPVLLTGADCLLTKDPRNCFLNDITLTLSDTFSDCKMNTGAIFVRDTEKASLVWQKVLDLKPKDWGEDQTFLYKAIRESNLSVAYLSCEEHNWAPNDINDDAHMPTIVHFRGKRKKYMKEWAKKYLDIR